jgi:hypothetical protein
MHFESRLASTPKKSVICLRNLYNEHIPMMCGCLLILAQSTCRMTQFTSDEVESVLQDFDVNKESGPDCIPPIILQNCAFAFAKPLSLILTMATSVFPDRWNVSYITPIFEKGKHNNVEDYHGVAILSAIPISEAF